MGGALATAAVIYAADQRLNPALRSVSSWVVFYVDVSGSWAEHLGRPHPLSWTLSEILGPSNALVPLALVGIATAAATRAVARGLAAAVDAAAVRGLLWRRLTPVRRLLPRRPSGARVAGGRGRTAPARHPDARGRPARGGSRRDGAAGDPGCGRCLARRLAAASSATTPYRPWVVQRADLALPWPAPVGATLAWIHPLAWLLIGTLAALLAGRERVAAASAQPPPAPTAPGTVPALAVAALALVLQLAGGESLPRALADPLEPGDARLLRGGARHARPARPAVHGRAAHRRGVAVQLLPRRPLDQRRDGVLPGCPHSGPTGWPASRPELERVRAEGGQAYLGQDGLVLLELRSDESPRALAAARRWLDEGRVTLWSPR